MADKKIEQLDKGSIIFMDDHQLKGEELEPGGDLSTVCSPLALTWLSLADIDRPDISWSVNYLGRAITKLIKACDKRLAI